MTRPLPNFVGFAEAVEIARKSPGAELVGLSFNAPFDYLGVYTIQLVDDEDSPYISIMFEGGALFDSGGEEDFYDEQDVPDEAQELLYAKVSELGDGKPNIRGMVSEYALVELLPGLEDESTYRSRAEFKQAAASAFLEYWPRT